MYQRVLSWLEKVFFPAVVLYATHPIVITITIGLLFPLIVFANATALVLVLGNYTNVTSAAVSSIVLAQQIHHHREIKKIHESHAEEIAKLHTKVDALQKTPRKSKMGL